jgi:glycosyltransferase involved in cell wall biosynthesis
MKHTLIVSPEKGGHCPFYLSLLAEAFTAEGCKILADIHNTDSLEHLKNRNIVVENYKFIEPCAGSSKDLINQIRELVVQYRFKTVFFAYLDAHLESLLMSNRPIGCSIAGIWFHPYALDRKYQWTPPLDKRLRSRRNIHFGLKRSIVARELKHIFFLDDASPTLLKSVNEEITSSILNDPSEHPSELSSEAARSHFNLPHDRTIFLHAGSSEPRKGFSDTVKAFKRLSRNKSLRDHIFLLRVGANPYLSKASRKDLDYLTEIGMAQASGEYVSQKEFIEYFSAADWVIIPYRNFRYSSGIFANAVSSNTPIIASNYGLIGRYASLLKNGDVYPHKDWKGLSRAVARHASDRRQCVHTGSQSHSKGEFIQQIQSAYKSAHI